MVNVTPAKLEAFEFCQRPAFSFLTCFSLSLTLPLSPSLSPAGVRVLVDAREKLCIPWGEPSNQKHGETVMAFDTRSAQGQVQADVFLKYLPAIRCLWADTGIQHAYDRRPEFQLVSRARYTRTHTDTPLRP